MGMYIGLARKVNNKFKHIKDIEGWSDEKYVGNSDFYDIMNENSEDFQPCPDYYESIIYSRPKDFNIVRKKVRKMTVNSEVFLKLIDKLEKNKDVYIWLDN